MVNAEKPQRVTEIQFARLVRHGATGDCAWYRATRRKQAFKSGVSTLTAKSLG